MKNYEYPRVRPPTSLQLPQQPAENRFSWMTTSGDQEDRVGARRETIIPIPTPPPGIAQQPSPQGGVPMPTMESQVYGGGGVVPYQIPRNPAVVQQQYMQAAQHHGAYTSQPYPVQVTGQQPQMQTTQYAMPPMPPSPQPPEPAKQPPIPENELTGPIEPDTNPLTPTTPKPPMRASTNMAIVPPPSDPSQFSANVFTPSPQSIKGGSWQHSFCSCAEPSTCITGLFCPCVVYGKTQYRLGLRDERKDPTNMLGYTAVNGSCIAFGLLCGVNGILTAIQHTRVRKTYNMSEEAGNVAGDCLKGICCCCCVVAQDEKEVRFREEQARKPAGSGTKKEGYVAPTTMTFNPPPQSR
ncbi:uncharacterized protein Z520_00814 [Fonsecaea multimorphosa CBS 102226]|uniref:DUF614 domain protein n=1 Tax=Fonsecaea multimorphosa CBS 102226 TaxID=1442371 RepID=A0A0D2J3Y1_9EURO|nr:uncharacterized protein Z520_00814 [Fonsecaea multimorphosa CBS 102226]KIY04122.1 hypothetical protein Z520_00814 [Fonsecaea multimorphosa CBS 102226]OAL31953.1 hypothetical protein AYO22_00823 [Fonsecaea multimorphosa]